MRSGTPSHDHTITGLHNIRSSHQGGVSQEYGVPMLMLILIPSGGSPVRYKVCFRFKYAIFQPCISSDKVFDSFYFYTLYCIKAHAIYQAVNEQQYQLRQAQRAEMFCRMFGSLDDLANCSPATHAVRELDWVNS